MRKAMWLFLAILFVAMVPMSAIAEAERGDVTGDGVIDGKDALKILRMVEGLLAPTDTDLVLGDVFPLPGTDGRLFGDGQLTREDADRVLRMSVGLVGRGAITGKFGPPEITDMAPSCGPVA